MIGLLIRLPALFATKRSTSACARGWGTSKKDFKQRESEAGYLSDFICQANLLFSG
ncbi:hypothetical protein ACMSI6_10390 [Pseudomonas antarctica]|uniref:hypothetical protein n=1 Tax=Pseudomonas antarctica TaxID=219572 RepID=UPI0012EA1716|nr:hypothetical protein [Pseudomonas antarctica]